MNRVFLSLGSNLGEREEYLAEAIGQLNQIAGLVVRISGIYETEPWGFATDTKFLNMVVELNTELEPSLLLQECISIERSLGRVRNDTVGYSSRTIDIDILFYNDLITSSVNLVVPHPHIQDRKFILEPMNELEQNFIHPLLMRTVSQLLENCSDSGVVTFFGRMNNGL